MIFPSARPPTFLVPGLPVLALLVLGLLVTGCHDPDAPPRPAPAVGHDPFVLEHMGRGGAVRRVIYEPPPDLAAPAPFEIEPAQPGPGTGPGDEVDPADPDEGPGADADEDAEPDADPGVDPG